MKLFNRCGVGATAVAGTLAACTATVNGAASATADAGFWTGVWHGLAAPVTLVLSLFSEIGVYEVSNSGLGYNAGFLLGIALLCGILASMDDSDAILVIAGGAILLVGVVQLALIVFALLLALSKR